MALPRRPKPYTTRRKPTKSETAWFLWCQEMIKALEMRYTMICNTYELEENVSTEAIRLFLRNLLVAFGKESYEEKPGEGRA